MEEEFNKDEAYPKYFFNKITDITVEDLKEMGVKAVAVDLDNTTVKDATFEILRGVKKWMAEIKANGYPIVIVTNTYPLRAWYISLKMGRLPFYAFAKKPEPDKLIRAAKKLGLEPSDMVLVGDLLFADVMAANRCGAISVKVEPYGKEKLFKKRFSRLRRKEKEYLEEREKNGNS